MSTERTALGGVDSEFIEAAEAASILRVSGRTFERYVAAGLVPVAFRTLGGRRRFNRAAIEALPRADRPAKAS